eukprot:ANDGO_01729.mRNA.1 hypothetical protein
MRHTASAVVLVVGVVVVMSAMFGGVVHAVTGDTLLFDNFYTGDLDAIGCSCDATLPNGSWDNTRNCYCVSGICDRQRIAAEPCVSGLQCFSGNCTSGLCAAVPTGQPCLRSRARTYRGEIPNPCARDSFCTFNDSSSLRGMCVPKLPLGSACGWQEQYYDGCSAGTFCYIANEDSGTCVPMFQRGFEASCSGGSFSDDFYCKASLVCADGVCQQNTPFLCETDSDCPRLSGGCAVSTGKCLAANPAVINVTKCDESYQSLVSCLAQHQCSWTVGGAPTLQDSCKSHCFRELIQVSCCETPNALPEGLSCSVDAFIPPPTAGCRSLGANSGSDSTRVCSLCVFAIVLGVAMLVAGVCLLRFGVNSSTIRLLSWMMFVGSFASILTGFLVQFAGYDCAVCLFCIIFQTPFVLTWIVGSLFYRRNLYGKTVASEYAMFDVPSASRDDPDAD